MYISLTYTGVPSIILHKTGHRTTFIIFFPSTAHDYLLVGVESDGSLLIEAQFSDLDSQEVHGAKLTPSAHQIDVFDGYRHHVVITRSPTEWTLKVTFISFSFD